MAMPNAPALVGILDSAELMAADSRVWLCAEEFQDYSLIRNQRRKDEWLAGRVAAKFVFLERERSSAPSAEPCLRQIDAGALAEFPSETYREVIVSRDVSPAGGPARIGWRSKEERVRAAISHVNGTACAFIGSTETYSVDLEAPSPRIPAFYVHNFTPRERSWTSACASAFDLDSDWLYTLLWSAKECLLKTPAFATLSLWNMSSIEINIQAGSERLKAVHQSRGLSGNLEFLRAETLQRLGPPKHFQLAVGGTAKLILAVMTTLN
jgi:4'-phosphopantetheinyl transferase EntD